MRRIGSTSTGVKPKVTASELPKATNTAACHSGEPPRLTIMLRIASKDARSAIGVNSLNASEVDKTVADEISDARIGIAIRLLNGTDVC